MINFFKKGIAVFAFITLSCLGYGQSADNPAPAAADPAAFVTSAPSAPSAATEPSVETIVCVRHGEKPSMEIGQLDVRGLNRSLELPKVLLGKYGKPQFIFAPDPAKTIGRADGNQYCYVRPLATIEPTAILCDLPVNTMYGFKDIQGLETELRKPMYQSAVIFVAWEHQFLERFARALVIDLGGDGTQVPAWDKSGMGYDAIYLIKITTQNGQSTVEFSVDHEGLDHPSGDFPGSALPTQSSP